MFRMTQSEILTTRNYVLEVLRARGVNDQPELIGQITSYCVHLKVYKLPAIELLVDSATAVGLTQDDRIQKIVKAVIINNSDDDFVNLPTGQNEINALAEAAVEYIDFKYSNCYAVVKQAIILAMESIAKSKQTRVGTTPRGVEMLTLEENFYRSLRNDDEIVVAREYGIHPVSGMPMQGTWVMRNYHTGEFIDSDRYINDLSERNNLRLSE